MKRLMFVAVASLSLWSCQPKSNSQFQATPQSTGAKQEAGSVTLDQAAQDAAHIVVEQIHPESVARSVVAPGQLMVNEDRTWRVGAIASGKIDGLFVKLGDSVRAGQILARIHSHDVHDTRAAYREASVELDRARSATAYATQRRDRAKRLLDLKAGSRQDLELAESELVDAQAEISKAQAEVRKERIHLTDILHVSVDDGSQSGSVAYSPGQHDDTQDDIPVLAPASAVVFERKPSVGSVVNAGDVLFLLTDTSSLWMIAAANESNLSMLHAGQISEIGVRAYPDKAFRGRILKLGEELDPTTRTLEVRILIPNPHGLLKPGMYASAKMEQAQRRPAIFLPEAAVQDIDGVPAVFVRVAGNRFEPRTIKTGQHINGRTEVLEGLSAGEAVVVKGSFMVKSQLLKSTIQED
jgi:cobalt-zinc-cadmium efflux system membrane fusion protein